MSRIIFGLLLVVAIFSQATLIPVLSPWSVFPNTVLVLLFVWCGWCGPREGLFWIFLAGILLDVVTMGTLGVNVLALVPVLLLATVAKEYVYHSAAIVPALLMAVATVVSGLVLCVAHGNPPGLYLLIQAAMHAVLVFVLFPFVARASRDVRRY
ncbi:MAG: rod shape-determining protein MreD [Thermomicrobiales bacterium]